MRENELKCGYCWFSLIKARFVDNYYTCENCAKSYEYKLVPCN